VVKNRYTAFWVYDKVFNQKQLWIYTNAALLGKPRLYNSTYYPGMQ